MVDTKHCILRKESSDCKEKGIIVGNPVIIKIIGMHTRRSKASAF